MCAIDRHAPLAASARSEQQRSHKLLHSYPEAVDYHLKNYANDQAIAEYDASVLRYMQPASMTFQQYAGDLIAKSRKDADVYDEDTPNNVFIEEVNQSLRHSLQNYWATNPEADLTDIAFQAESVLAIQKKSGQQPVVCKPPTDSGKP